MTSSNISKESRIEISGIYRTQAFGKLAKDFGVLQPVAPWRIIGSKSNLWSDNVDTNIERWLFEIMIDSKHINVNSNIFQRRSYEWDGYLIDKKTKLLSGKMIDSENFRQL